jgi:glyoxylase-like metal-dependent hydrolase (beta-lactamase superfamily II)
MDVVPLATAGRFALHAVSDGRLATSHDCVLGITTAEVGRLTGVPEGQPINLPVYSFVFEAEGRRVLVDAGAGNSMGPTLGHLPANLGLLGLKPDDIDAILLTHCHSDHSNGLVDGQGAPVYRNATIYLNAGEAAFWLDREIRDTDSDRVKRNSLKARAVLAPYQERLVRVNAGALWPGVTAVPRTGHTPGHTTWLLEDGGEQLLIWGDMVHIAAVQVPRPDCGLVFDVDAAAGAVSRKAVLAWASGTASVVAGAHLHGGFGRVTAGPAGYAVQPVAG